MVLGKMRPEIDPCTDFYNFACGTFLNETNLIEDKNYITTISGLEDRVKEQLLAVMKEQRPERDPKHLKLPSTLYMACTNTGGFIFERVAGGVFIYLDRKMFNFYGFYRLN